MSVQGIFRKIINYFIGGLLILAPLTVTVWFFIFITQKASELLTKQFEWWYVGAAVLGTLLLGYVSAHFISQSISRQVEALLKKIPLLSTIFFSLKDLTEAFLGNQEKFNQPVLFRQNTGVGEQVPVLGFVTRRDVEILGDDEWLAVYIPFSFTYTGKTVFAKKQWVTPLDIDRKEALKFVLSGGITGLQTGNKTVLNTFESKSTKQE